ncbi:MAG: hypothetical protein WEA31_01410, partial [Pirellulales bacterium]
CCEPAPCCDPCRKHCGLFSGLFHKCRKPACGCETVSECGCGGGVDYGYEVEGDAVPQPPVMEEPMAFRGGLFKAMPVAFGR